MQCNRFAELAQVYKGGLLPPEMQRVLSQGRMRCAAICALAQLGIRSLWGFICWTGFGNCAGVVLAMMGPKFRAAVGLKTLSKEVHLLLLGSRYKKSIPH